MCTGTYFLWTSDSKVAIKEYGALIVSTHDVIILCELRYRREPERFVRAKKVIPEGRVFV